MSEKTKPTFLSKCKNFFKTVWDGIKSVAKKAFRGFMNAKSFWSAFAILVILLVISIVVLSLRLHDYTKLDDRSVSLRSSMDETLEVFAVEYKNDAGEIVIQGSDGEKVIAPGSDVEYTLRLRNTDKVALDYSFLPDLKHTSEYELPIEIRLLDPDDNYVIGSETEWIPLAELEDVEKCTGTLLPNVTAEYIFQWRWPYESGDDSYDSFLGSVAFDGTIGVDLSFALHAEANTTIDANGGFFGSPTGNLVVLIVIFLLLAVSITLLLIHIIRRIKAKKAEPVEAIPVVQPVVEAPAVEEAPAPVVVAAPAAKPTFTGKMALVNLDVLEDHFASGSLITIGILKEKGIIPQSAKQMKILARSSVAISKAFMVETQGISKNAEVAICRAGGRVVIAAPDDSGEEKH